MGSLIPSKTDHLQEEDFSLLWAQSTTPWVSQLPLPYQQRLNCKTCEVKYPITLPKRHYVTALFIWEYHEKCSHSGLKYVLLLLRQQFWIIKARSTIRCHGVLTPGSAAEDRKRLMGPRNWQTYPRTELHRIYSHFTNVVVDCFGPIRQVPWNAMVSCLRAFYVTLYI